MSALRTTKASSAAGDVRTSEATTHAVEVSVSTKYRTRSSRKRRRADSEASQPPTKKPRLSRQRADEDAPNTASQGNDDLSAINDSLSVTTDAATEASQSQSQSGGSVRLRSLSGFCALCTNPRRLLGCAQCHRSFHWDCLRREFLPEDAADECDEDTAMRGSASIEATDASTVASTDPTTAAEGTSGSVESGEATAAARRANTAEPVRGPLQELSLSAHSQTQTQPQSREEEEEEKEEEEDTEMTDRHPSNSTAPTVSPPSGRQEPQQSQGQGRDHGAENIPPMGTRWVSPSPPPVDPTPVGVYLPTPDVATLAGMSSPPTPVTLFNRTSSPAEKVEQQFAALNVALDEDRDPSAALMLSHLRRLPLGDGVLAPDGTANHSRSSRTRRARREQRKPTRRTIDMHHEVPLCLDEPFPDRRAEPEIRAWFRNNEHVVARQVAYLEAQPSQFGEKEVLAGFLCYECRADVHPCFLCKKVELENQEEEEKAKEEEEEEEEEKGEEAKKEIGEKEPQKCMRCPLRFHVSCIKKKGFGPATHFFSNGSFTCPRHRCCVCAEDPELHHNSGGPRRICWYCPLTYCREHVGHRAPMAELVAAQLTDHQQVYKKWPNWKFDMLNCRPGADDVHPFTGDGQFGRDDQAHGIVNDISFDLDPEHKWQLQVNRFPRNFYIKPDDVDGFANAEKKLLRQRAKNPFPKGFKKIKKCKWSKAAKEKAKRQENMTDMVEACWCGDEGCQPGVCSNHTMQLECNKRICGARSTCHNRQFQKLKENANVEIQKTADRGFGAFAKRDFQANELVVEYVGEVITSHESERRLKQMNEDGAPNFYFLSFGSNLVADATHMGNTARFINHSCDPNCTAAMWDVNGERRMGIFTLCDIREGDEITYDYQYTVKGASAKSLAKCKCGAKACRGFLGFTKKMAEEYRAKQAKKKRKREKKQKRKLKKQRREAKEAKEAKRQKAAALQAKRGKANKVESSLTASLSAHGPVPGEPVAVSVPNPLFAAPVPVPDVEATSAALNGKLPSMPNFNISSQQAVAFPLDAGTLHALQRAAQQQHQAVPEQQALQRQGEPLDNSDPFKPRFPQESKPSAVAMRAAERLVENEKNRNDFSNSDKTCTSRTGA